MDWKTFIAEIFKALTMLAWPAVLALGGWYYQDEIRAVLRLRPTRLKAFGVEGEFEVPLQKAEALIAAAPAEPAVPVAPQTISRERDPEDQLFAHTLTLPTSGQREHLSPTVAIIRAFGVLRTHVNLVAKKRGIPFSSVGGWSGIEATTLALGLPAEEVAAIKELEQLQGEAVSGFPITEDQVRRYYDLVRRLISRLRKFENPPAISAAEPAPNG